MPVFMNNCHNRPHATYYGDGAFYDLGLTGVQRKQARNLRAGDLCVVASYGDHGVVFDRWKFSHESVLPAPEGCDVRVFFGEHLERATLPKLEAARSPEYAVFFDDSGDFKHASIVRE